MNVGTMMKVGNVVGTAAGAMSVPGILVKIGVGIALSVATDLVTKKVTEKLTENRAD